MKFILAILNFIGITNDKEMVRGMLIIELLIGLGMTAVMYFVLKLYIF